MKLTFRRAIEKKFNLLRYAKNIFVARVTIKLSIDLEFWTLASISPNSYQTLAVETAAIQSKSACADCKKNP
jgi:hypothetical protein